MKRQEMLKRLNEINVLTMNMVVTYDMGYQFDVLTSKGVSTDFGNVGNWPCYKLPFTEELIKLKERLENKEMVSNEEIIDVDICKTLLTYFYPGTGQSWIVEGDKLEKCVAHLKSALLSLNRELKYFYAYVNLEDWNDNNIVFFDEYEALNTYFGEQFGNNDSLYEDMDDEALAYVYEQAEEAGWNGVAYKEYTCDQD